MYNFPAMLPLKIIFMLNLDFFNKSPCGCNFSGGGVDGHFERQGPVDGGERRERQRQHDPGERADGAEAGQGVAGGGRLGRLSAARRPQPGGAAGARPRALRRLAAQLGQRDARVPGAERGRGARGRGQSAQQHRLQVAVAALVRHRG